MKRYRRKYRILNCIIQGFLAGLICLCFIGISRWVSSPSDLTQFGRRFEETTDFAQTIEQIIREKIVYQQDQTLFEQDGDFNENKQIDIRQYMAGISDEASRNLNTTFYLKDLLSFAEDGAKELADKIESLQSSGHTEEEIGQALEQEHVIPDTMLPVSGSTLSDYSRISANPYAVLTEYYRELCSVSLDIKVRYDRYIRNAGDGSGTDPRLAPSNVLYYVENTSNKQRFTNLGVKSILAAQTVIDSREDALLIFVGERRLNIMVSDTEELSDNTAVQYFMKTRFVGSGEKVLIAVDQSYSAGDPLREAHLLYRQRKPLLIGAAIVLVISMILLIILLIISIEVTGREYAGSPLQNKRFDVIPTELAAGIRLILIISWWMLVIHFSAAGQRIHPLMRYTYYPLCIVVEYWIILSMLRGYARRYKGKTLWTNSVCYTVILGSRQVLSAKKGSQILLILYTGFILLNMIFWLIGGAPGIIMAITLDFAALLYLMRDVVGNRTVREGLQQIAKGKLDYRINTQVLTGESREIGEAVNEMGIGLEKAVDSMLRNERLKSELITNVSHDLKTPLTSIINYVDLLKRENLQNEKAVEYVKVLETKTQRLKQLTEDLIEVSRISSGNITLHPQQIGLYQFILQACGEFEERFEDEGLKMDMQLQSGRPQIMADGAQLWRVFENLLGNIAKYAKKETKVLISMEEEEKENGKYVYVRFCNTSAVTITVSAQDLQERFVRGDASRRTEGSGLGLSIARSLTQLMEGTFEIHVTEDRFEAVIGFPAVND